jgi:methionine--tRNA ligase beta chain
MVTYEDFKKLDIRTARIIEARAHPSADRLYILDIDTGGEKRQIVAGIRRHYTAEELVGRDIAVILNIEPAVIRGIESNGMLLAASNEQGFSLLTPDKEIAPGSIIK